MDPARTLQRKIREMRGDLTYRAYADKLGLSLSTLYSVFNANHNATLRTIDQISRALGITPAQLLDDADTHHKEKGNRCFD